MQSLIERALVVLLLLAASMSGRALAQSADPAASSRIGLVIGIGGSAGATLPTAVNDAGLVAQTLAAAGFDVTGARDLDGEGLRKVIREFLAKAGSLGPDGIAVVYFAGRALQFDGENYLVPADANVGRETDLPMQAMRLNDVARALSALPLSAKIIVIDGAYAAPETSSRYADGLAIVEPGQNTLIAFNAAPGTVAPINAENYGTYARILTQTMKQGGVPVEDVFARVRIAVNAATHGTVAPWETSKLTQTFQFFDRTPDAPATGSAQIPFASLRKRPLRDFSPEQAYDVALARDSLPAYQEYLTVFPDVPLARRVRIMLAARREALFWREALTSNAPAAYWTYLRRYPKGQHASEAQRRLARLAAAKAPPPNFAPLAFDVPPPPESEYRIVERRFRFDDPELEPPPPAPVFILPPPAQEIVILPPPTASTAGFLPIPAAAPIPFVRPAAVPGRILPPRGLKGSYPQPRPAGEAPAPQGNIVEPATGQRAPDLPRLGRKEAPARNPQNSPPLQPGVVPDARTALPNGGPAPAVISDKKRARQRLPVPDRPPVPASTIVVPERTQPDRGLPSGPEVQAPAPGALQQGKRPARRRNDPGTIPAGMPDQPSPTVPQLSLPRRMQPVAVPASPGEGTGAARLPGEPRRRTIPPGAAPAPVQPAPQTEAPATRFQQQRLLGAPPAQFAPRPVAPDLRPAEPRQRPQQQFAPPPAADVQGRGVGGGNRNFGRPECGHPGQPPCHP